MSYYKGVRISSASPERIEYSLQKSLASEAPSFVVGPGQKHTNSEAEQKEGTSLILLSLIMCKMNYLQSLKLLAFIFSRMVLKWRNMY